MTAARPTAAARAARLAASVGTGRRTAELALAVPLAMLAGALVVLHLDSYPRMWLDEGFLLQVPRSLVLYGDYAMRSASGVSLFDPAITTGPTVLLPIAGVWAIAGVGLLEARLVIALYCALLLMMLYLVARACCGYRVAAVAVLLLVTAPLIWVNPTYMGRLVMGEVPAMALLLGGMLCWIGDLDRPRRATLLGSGLLFGLAMVTKPQHLVAGVALLALLPVVLRLSGEHRAWRRSLALLPVAAALPAVWYAYQIWVQGLAGFLDHLDQLSAMAANGGSGLALAPGNILERAGSLFELHLFTAISVAAGVLVWQQARRERRDPRVVTLLLAWGVWTAAYLFLFSMPWVRYAFPAFALGAVFVAWLLARLSDGFTVAGRMSLARRGRHLAVVAVIALFAAAGTTGRINAITTEASDAPQQMAAYLTAAVPPDAVIQTLEMELTVLTQHRYDYPSTPLQVEIKSHRWLQAPYSERYASFLGSRPDYVVVGDYARYTSFYPAGFLDAASHVITIGPYALYRTGG